MCIFLCCQSFVYFFFFKQKTAYEMRISDWSSDVCSSDLCCDTSPRGLDLPGDAEHWDFGVGAGFYVDATQAPWSGHYRMGSYVNDEQIGRASCRERVCQYV